MNNKVISYIGFALKSGSIIFGADDIIKSKKNLGVILYKEDINENVLNKLKSKKNVPFIEMTSELNTLEKLKGAKVIYITDKNLSEAIVSNAK